MVNDVVSGITDDDVEQSRASGVLSPAYFAARREEFDIKTADIEKTVKKCLKTLEDGLSEYCESIAFDGWMDHNLRRRLESLVDSIVRAILGGNEHVAHYYVMREDWPDVRAAVARLYGDDVAKKRIEELEAEVESLRKSYRFW